MISSSMVVPEQANNGTNVEIVSASVVPSFKRMEERGYLPEVKQQITEMALNGSGIRDTARVLRISPTTVIEALKKRSSPEGDQ